MPTSFDSGEWLTGYTYAPQCPKCLHADMDWQYAAVQDAEWLKLTCCRCGYSLQMPVAPDNSLVVAPTLYGGSP